MTEKKLIIIASTVIALALLVGMFVGAVNSERQKADIAKACVVSGGEWVRDFGAYYKCVRP